MERRLGRDFRVPFTSTPMPESARDLGAEAYTVGAHIAFAHGRCTPSTNAGTRLLAHELAHVAQQSGAGVVRRCVNPKKNDPIYDAVAKAIRANATYKAQASADQAVADGIIVDAKKKPGAFTTSASCRRFSPLGDKPPAQISIETQTATTAARRPGTDARQKTGRRRKTRCRGRVIGSGQNLRQDQGQVRRRYPEVDRSNPKNIVVRAKVHLQKAGTGTMPTSPVSSRWRTPSKRLPRPRGLLVDVTFVDVADAETFTANVDPSQWETATRWSGGDPTGFAHELFHMFAYRMDCYDYIQSHARNDSMLGKTGCIGLHSSLRSPGFDNPASLMGEGSHPLDDDARRVAGLDIATCVAIRRSK
jgi:hypothetical protein